MMSIINKLHKVRIFFLQSLFVSAIALSACKKLVTIVPPSTSITGGSVYSSDATAIAAVTSLYVSLSGNGNFSGYLNALYLGLSADEFSSYIQAGGNTSLYYQNALATSTDNFWSVNYNNIFTVNSIIEGLNVSSSLTPSIKQQLLGEAKFMRAFYYFYLVNLYGDVPLVLTSDYKVNTTLSRESKAQVYMQILKDLQDAQGLLSNTFFDGSLLKTTTERVRPTKWAATALLARAYLYQAGLAGDAGSYGNAVIQATTLISNNSLFSLNTLLTAFLKASLGNKEAIWQLQTTASTLNTYEAQNLIIPGSGPSSSYPYYLNNSLMSDFESGDQRKTNWTGNVTLGLNTYYYPYKYKVLPNAGSVTEYEMVFRLGEIYLIRAEAEANGGGGGINAAVTDLNTIRTRAGLGVYAGATDKAGLLAAILHERRVELFTEWGHRWLDLKRTGTVDAVMGTATPQKGGIWSSYKQLFPIPLLDIHSDINLVQNTGY